MTFCFKLKIRIYHCLLWETNVDIQMPLTFCNVLRLKIVHQCSTGICLFNVCLHLTFHDCTKNTFLYSFIKWWLQQMVLSFLCCNLHISIFVFYFTKAALNCYFPLQKPHGLSRLCDILQEIYKYMSIACRYDWIPWPGQTSTKLLMLAILLNPKI